jgi:uncharacterized protein YggT (Ycf19 family)
MSTHVQQVRHTGGNGRVTTRTTRVDDDAYTEHNYAEPASLLARIVWYAAGVLITLLAFRFVLALLGANPNNQFASFIYDVSHPFVAPFFSLFGYNLQYGVSRFEIFTLVAMLVYSVIALGIARLFTITRDAATDA